jgi:hypothetical protein
MNRKISRNKVLFAVYIRKKSCYVVLGEIIVPARGGIHKADPHVKGGNEIGVFSHGISDVNV